MRVGGKTRRVAAWAAGMVLALASVAAPAAAQESEAATQAGQTDTCGVLRSSADYWFCKALWQKQSGLAQGDDYWRCMGLVTKSCGLNARSDDMWFCLSLLQDQCGLNARSDRYWLCEAVRQSDCGLARGGDFWWCEAIGPAIRSLKAPPKAEPEAVSGFVL